MPDIVSLPIVIDPEAVAPLVELPYVVIVLEDELSVFFAHEINTKDIINKVNENFLTYCSPLLNYI